MCDQARHPVDMICLEIGASCGENTKYGFNCLFQCKNHKIMFLIMQF